LQENYSDYALFFYDIYGGSVIAVLWKPQALLPKDFKVRKYTFELSMFSPPELLFKSCFNLLKICICICEHMKENVLRNLVCMFRQLGTATVFLRHTA
jgi:hypothetical protein